MLKSMTGFGRSDCQNEDLNCKVEIRSVNNRFIEINIRLQKSLQQLEAPLKKLVKSRCARGSFDVSITLEKMNGNTNNVVIAPNIPLASQYMEAFNQIKQELNLSGEIDINSVLAQRDVVKVEPEQTNPNKESLISETVNLALTSLLEMRQEEGQSLQTDISQRLDEIAKHGDIIRDRQPVVLQEYKDRLNERIKVLNDGVELEPLRLAQETALMADRCDVTEEIVRLKSHLEQFQKLLNIGQPVGRKLEFITQEINREVNTIGSKTIDATVSQSVIEMKSDLEKIREQLQNIE
jgi:uncharacterized protein (TIGR00255 family)